MLSGALRRIRAQRIWPTSLAARTALVLLGGLLLSQVGGLMLHALDRAEMLHSAQEHEMARRLMSTYRGLVLARPEQRANLIDQARVPGDLALSLSEAEPAFTLPPASATLQRHMLSHTQIIPLPPSLRPRQILVHGNDDHSRVAVALQLPEGQWLAAEMTLRPVWPWHSNAFLATFGIMSGVAALLTLWAVRRLVEPVATLAGAAEALGRDVNAPPLPETGPAELATAAAAFNTMAARIRRFVDDRTFLLTAIGHDLRTPITRLRLRAEFMEDDDQRRRMLADLDELEAMVNATLAFGRDATASEPAVAVDLAALVNTVLTEAGDARPELPAAAVAYAGPDHLAVTARPVALKRALTNLVANALNYGGSARVRLLPPEAGQVVLHVDDDGPGIPPAELERVFLPFQRLEPSRNRETGGMGLGLPITRNIARAHGGDVTLQNRADGGLRATLILPA
jgi:signal transduction histidine kinase